MSSYPPPTDEGTIFNPLNYSTAGGDITVDYLNANYLKFPIAQGFETFVGSNNQAITDCQAEIEMNGSKITLCGNPTAPQDVATKDYVDSVITSSTITDTNTDATYYPVFVAAAGSQPLLADIATTPFSINPNTGNLTLATTINITQSNLAVGKNAGVTSQGAGSVAVGFGAANFTQSTNAVAIGVGAAQNNQGASAVAIGSLTGQTSQAASAIAIGAGAGNSTQGGNSVAIGLNAGSITQGNSSVAVGDSAGTTTQGSGAVAVGNDAGVTNQGVNSVAVGDAAGATNQSTNSVAVGVNSGNSAQGASAVAVGSSAGQTTQGATSVAIGQNAGLFSQGAGACAIGVNAGAGVSGVNFQGANAVLRLVLVLRITIKVLMRWRLE
jgi:hypothetical protein